MPRVVVVEDGDEPGVGAPETGVRRRLHAARSLVVHHLGAPLHLVPAGLDQLLDCTGVTAVVDDHHLQVPQRLLHDAPNGAIQQDGPILGPGHDRHRRRIRQSPSSSPHRALAATRFRSPQTLSTPVPSPRRSGGWRAAHAPWSIWPSFVTGGSRPRQPRRPSPQHGDHLSMRVHRARVITSSEPVRAPASAATLPWSRSPARLPFFGSNAPAVIDQSGAPTRQVGSTSGAGRH